MAFFLFYQKGAEDVLKRKHESIPIIEVGFSILSACLALVLFSRPDMFDRLPATYEFFKVFAPEYVWGLFFVAASLTKLLGLLTRKSAIRKTGLVGSVIIYGLIAAAYFLGAGWFSIGFFTYSVLSFMALFSVREVDLLNGK